MRSKLSSPLVEAYCNRCHVSTPVERKRCLHCGGPLEAQRRWTQVNHPVPVELDLAADEHFQDALPEDELPRRSGLSPLTLVWIALLLAGYLYRSCVS